MPVSRRTGYGHAKQRRDPATRPFADKARALLLTPVLGGVSPTGGAR